MIRFFVLKKLKFSEKAFEKMPHTALPSPSNRPSHANKEKKISLSLYVIRRKKISSSSSDSRE